MSRRKRLRWPWWVGGIIAVLIASAYVDYKYVLPVFTDTSAEMLPPGGVGRLAGSRTYCFRTSDDADAALQFLHDSDQPVSAHGRPC